MKKEQWKIVKALSLLPFFAFVPITASAIYPYYEISFWGFFAYFAVWVVTVSLVEKNRLPRRWKRNMAIHFGGIILLQILITVICGIIMLNTYEYDPVKPKMKLKKPNVKMEPNQGMDLTVKTPVD